ncbi:NAD-dependent epimerase/dehydratase family protein [Arcobacter sp.]|uniref:NAD-dependent epimerase/dehydratase family protein n=1 Tax=Arcobacter sp. TaxID=1872629 RepID=UPI003C74062A
MEKLLITGLNGFIGSYFKNKYKNKYDIKSFSFLNNDINTLNCNNIDVVFHLSALVHQMGGASREEYERVNVTQTLDLAQKAKESGVKHFVFMSTVKVYGEETDSKYIENSICNPEDEYGKSKLKAEQELLGLSDEGLGFRVSIVRTPIVYGHGVKANIKSLVELTSKIPILPFGKIENKRSMVYIGNLCHLVDEVIKQEKSGIFLASDDEPLSTTRLIELIAKNLDKKVYLIKIPFFQSLLKLLKPSFHKRLYGSLEIDNTITKEKLNLKNPYSVEEGISLMLKDIRD